MLEYSHDYMLVFASMAVSLMASFTGLSLTRGISRLPPAQRKLRVVMGAIALGGGIWSMHFVAMLGLKLPILYYYDALTTLMSALVAILMVGVALLVMHFRPRTTATTVLAGSIVGLGIPIMHYIGMSGMQLCQPVYTPLAVVLAVISSVALGIGSIAIAYGQRTHRNIMLGTITFGCAVFAVHFLAMAGTNFTLAEGGPAAIASIDNAVLAIIVTLISFVICGAFLLSSVTFLPQSTPETHPHVPSNTPPEVEPMTTAEAPAQNLSSIPYQRDGQIQFVRPEDVSALRAEGHYTLLYAGKRKLFCQWSISDADERLTECGFVRCHRSYLINPAHVSRFERKKDNGFCDFESSPALGSVPVSRSRLNEVRAALGL
jgi:NO-binding membrane sensor protein with MHYT domain